jgi:hypothetical protein
VTEIDLYLPFQSVFITTKVVGSLIIIQFATVIDVDKW